LQASFTGGASSASPGSRHAQLQHQHQHQQQTSQSSQQLIYTWAALSEPILPGAIQSLRWRIRINTAVLLMDCEAFMPCSAPGGSVYAHSAAAAAAAPQQ